MTSTRALKTDRHTSDDTSPDSAEVDFDLSFERIEGGQLRLITRTSAVALGLLPGERDEPPERPRLQDDEFEELEPVNALMHREQTYRRFLAVADGSAALAAVLAVRYLWSQSFSWQLLLAPLLAVLISKIQGLYDQDDMTLRMTTVSEWRPVLRSSALIGIASYVVWYSATASPADRGLRVFWALVAATFLLTLPARALARAVARRVSAEEHCLIIGDPKRCIQLAHRVNEIDGIKLTGIVDNAHIDPSVAGVRELSQQLGVQRIIVGPHREADEPQVLTLTRSAKWLGVRISLMPTVMTLVGATTAVDELDTMVLFGIPRFGLSRSSAALKRALDLLLGGTLVLLLAPLMAVIAVAIKLDSRGPVFFRQQRIGRDARPFVMYKFRSMVDGADRLQAALGQDNESNGLFKMAADPRITRVGRKLRKAYLDELPQLFNVLRGQMSLVGPRPLVESEDAMLTGHDRHRLRLTPGMTGPWQLRGPLNSSLAELARLDYMYASNWSIWADIDILLGTVGRVLNRHGV